MFVLHLNICLSLKSTWMQRNLSIVMKLIEIIISILYTFVSFSTLFCVGCFISYKILQTWVDYSVLYEQLWLFYALTRELVLFLVLFWKICIYLYLLILDVKHSNKHYIHSTFVWYTYATTCLYTLVQFWARKPSLA